MAATTFDRASLPPSSEERLIRTARASDDAARVLHGGSPPRIAPPMASV